MVATRKPAVLPFLEGERLHDAVGRWAARTPSAIAAEHVGQSISYAELWEWSDRLAVRLRDLGVKPRRNVVVILERGFGLLAALLAISKAGGASVPIDMHSPKERAQAILEESDPAAVLTEDWTMETAGSPLFAAVRPSEFQFKGIREWPSGEGDPTPPKAEDAAAILYTSGSTGVPKGVVLPHRAFVAFISGHVSMMGLGPGARVLQFASPAFDVAFEEVFGALSSGSTLVIRTDEWLADSGKFWKLCSDHRISFADLPARFWRSIVVDAKADPPDCLLSVIIGGEAAPRDALEAWFQKPGRLPRLYNAYGPTEATVSATIREMTADPSGWSSIGRPLPNVDVYILDKRLEPVPVGIVGELYIGGRGLAEGYLKRPELTAQRFLSDPFTGGTIYRTGDLGRWMPDGTIDFIGRNDSQVKLRGFRIELGEVETRLLDESGIRYAVATVREDIPGDQRLVAYVVCDADADLVALRGRLRASLPDYMIPSTICRIESIPLTSGGKPDRAALPLPEPSKVSEVHRCDDPDGEIEVALADIWIDLLKVVKVGRGDDFFDLGGHSLLGIRLSTRITEVFSVAFGIKDVFAARSLRGMAEIIIDRQLSQYGFE
jgi:amino acid adenylation domain-containing protein